MRYAALVLILLAGGISAQDSAKGKSYLCIPDRAAGFSFNKARKTWENTNFDVSENKYLLRPITSDDKSYFGTPLKGVYGVWRLGEDTSFVQCEEGISEHSWLYCGGNFNTRFVFNSRSNRFTYV